MVKKVKKMVQNHLQTKKNQTSNIRLFSVFSTKTHKKILPRSNPPFFPSFQMFFTLLQ
jgi:hypothetical protein